MAHKPSQRKQPTRDIRAPQGLNLSSPPLTRGILLFIFADAWSLVLAWQIALYLNQFHSPIPAQLIWWTWWSVPSLFWLFALTTLLLFAQGGLYQISWAVGQNYVRAAQLVSVVYLGFLVLVYFYDPKLDLPRSLFFSAWFSSIILVILFRLLLNLTWSQLLNKNQPTTVFLLAKGHQIQRLGEIIENRANYRLVGIALASTAHSANLITTIINSGAQEVLATDLPNTELASTLYWRLRQSGITLRLIPSSLEMLHRRGVPEIFAGLPTLRLDTHLFVGWDYRLKCWLDFWLALGGLVILAPILGGIAIAIKLSSPGPVFFRQERIGLHGKVFQMWKFRTMVVNAPALQAQLETQNQSKDGILFKIKHDPRVTPLGHFLRRTSLDELPQLFNVLGGEMSLVGPRPLPLRDVERFETWHHIRHQVLPGITGIWQISGRSDLSDFDDATRLDLYYIDNWSLNLDLDILVETMKIIIFGKGAY
jgi:exopolysaccharide biosynthesis polyprenyl glycosylphosphotransferase